MKGSRTMIAQPVSSNIARSALPYAIFYVVVAALSLPIYGFYWHLTLHIFGAIIFIGNIIVTAVWMILAEQTRDARTIQFATRAINRADLFFTAPGVILVLLNGLALASMRWGGWGDFYDHSWITAALILFSLSGIIWVALLLPHQIKMERVTARNGDGRELPGDFYSLLHRWYLWGGIATILPLVSLFLMVNKPDLW